MTDLIHASPRDLRKIMLVGGGATQLLFCEKWQLSKDRAYRWIEPQTSVTLA